jgi:CheY-like chemotaxis protein
MKIKVLLVEDENAWLFIEILSQYNGFEFVTTGQGDPYTTRGDQAVELARAARPDIILMDLRLPVMGGLDDIRHIRRFEPALPIIAFSAYTDRRTRDRAMAAGSTAFFTKPPNYRQLYQLICQLVAQAAPAQAAADEQNIIAQKQRRLQELKLKQARYGLEAPVHILTEIEDLTAEIEQLSGQSGTFGTSTL